MQHKRARLLYGAALSTLAFLGATAQTQAQQMQPAPVELYVCNFVNGKGMSDLRAVNAQWNKWADEQGITNMFSSMYTPMFHSTDDSPDVYFLDGWPDGAALGAGYTRFYSPSGIRMGAAYDAVVKCSSHMYFSGVMVVPPAEGRDGGPIQFQDCKLGEQRTVNDAIDAIKAFSSGAGPKLGGFALLQPFVGQPRKIDYDFKVVAIFDSYQTMGNAFDVMLKGAGGRQAASTIGKVVSCDMPRIYNQIVIRRRKES